MHIKAFHKRKYSFGTYCNFHSSRWESKQKFDYNANIRDKSLPGAGEVSAVHPGNEIRFVGQINEIIRTKFNHDQYQQHLNFSLKTIVVNTK